LKQKSVESQEKATVNATETLNEWDFKERMSWANIDEKRQQLFWEQARRGKYGPWVPCKNSLGQDSVCKRAPEVTQDIHRLANVSSRRRKFASQAPDALTPAASRQLGLARLQPDGESFVGDESVGGSIAAMPPPKLKDVVPITPAQVAQPGARAPRRLPPSWGVQQAHPFALAPAAAAQTEPVAPAGIAVAEQGAVTPKGSRKCKEPDISEDDIREELEQFDDHIKDPLDFERCKHLMSRLCDIELARMKVTLFLTHAKNQIKHF